MFERKDGKVRVPRRTQQARRTTESSSIHPLEQSTIDPLERVLVVTFSLAGVRGGRVPGLFEEPAVDAVQRHRGRRAGDQQAADAHQQDAQGVQGRARVEGVRR
eukprot:2142687-Pyramimonas_sp.AAC.1